VTRAMIYVHSFAATASILGLVLGAASITAGCTSRASPHRIVVVQDRPAEWADALKLGFADGLAAAGFEPGKEVTVIHLSSAGEAQTLTSIAQGLRGGGQALIFTLGTQASQAVFSAVRDTPIVFGAVTDPVLAGFFDGALDKPLGDITGTQDIWPYEAQFDLIQKLRPGIKKIGILANPSEINTQVSVSQIRGLASARDIEIVERPVLNQSEVAPATAALLNASVDAVFLPADNTVQTAASTIIAACNARKVPVFTGIPGIVENGALATVGTNYYELGKVNGELAARILRGEKAGAIPVSVARRGDVHINLSAARALGIEIPSEVRDGAFKVYE
jgi:putative ABC transport system substrate-binding protein